MRLCTVCATGWMDSWFHAWQAVWTAVCMLGWMAVQLVGPHRKNLSVTLILDKLSICPVYQDSLHLVMHKHLRELNSYMFECHIRGQVKKYNKHLKPCFLGEYKLKVLLDATTLLILT